MKNLILIFTLSALISSLSFSQTGYGTEVTGNFVLPIGKNAEDYSVGFGGLVGFYYDITENFRLALVLGYLHVPINESKINGDFTSGGQQGTINVSGGVGAIPAIFSLRLVSPGPKMRFYGLLEGGLYTYSTSISGSYTLGGSTIQVDESEFRSEPGFAFGGGVLFPLNEELSVDANVRYHWVRDSEYINYGSGSSIDNSRLLSIGVGVNWFFPLK
ncbi:MAG: outer membrane beta-barrel protein [Ignavibacteria bacterium]|nr:outer membrane beta-barrel protein [Ignavibacteria bacterium]MBT8390750.1 outer membrane beta-barrel protein [Ignavibacteria bacterium]NNJ53419.1 outer membrane beta-barrel protein [Ignavibacteriaceae bacterium]NNL22406.1 outer membrane beta-barrel protein [Ignavibacteriaceae bacterium]